MKFYAAMIGLSLMIFTAACASITPTNPVANTSIPESTEEAYPGYQSPENINNPAESYPVPAGSAAELATLQPGTLPVTPDNAPVPEAGKASISGVLFSFNGHYAVAGTLFFLTAASGPDNNYPPPFSSGPSVEKGDITAYSDDQGYIMLNNIPPGKYYLIMYGGYDWPMAIISPDAETPLQIILAADQALNLGVIYIPWP